MEDGIERFFGSADLALGGSLKLTFNQRIKLHSYYDRGFRWLTLFFAILALILIANFLFHLIIGSLPAMRAFGWKFLITEKWDPVHQQFGALGPIVGTLLTSLIALMIAIPISFGIAIFLTELSPRWLKQPLRIAIELLAGIPSIIYGMWGLFVFAPLFAKHVQPALINTLGTWKLIGPLFQGPPLGIGILTAGIILGIMVIPFMATVTRDVFEVTPGLLKESAYAMGATTWEVVWQIVLPFARKGVIGAGMLGLGRALGETMAVAFVIGNAHRLSLSILMPGNSIPSVLANEFTEATGEIYTSALIELGLILFFITCVVILLSRLLINRLGR